MQSISDHLTEKTEYDAYIDQQTGRIKLKKLCDFLGSTVWALVFAKARACFQLSDITNRKQLKKKYNMIFYTCLLVLFAQLLKSCADSSYADNLIDNIEDKIDSAIFTAPDTKSGNE